MSTFLSEVEEIIRETFEGGLPGQGTQYLDHDSGIVNTIKRISYIKASERPNKHISIASHISHMTFHLKVAYEWIKGDHSKRDWSKSFEPSKVNEQEWKKLIQEFDESKIQYLQAIRNLPNEKLISDSGAFGIIAHLAYHLGAIRQLL